MVKIGSVVIATHEHIDEGELFARPGDRGRVHGVDRYEDGAVALTVAWENAPQVTTSFLGDDCELAASA